MHEFPSQTPKQEADSTPTTEKEPRFPSLEEIRSQIERLSGQENPETLRTLEDENGIYLHEVVTVDEKGDASIVSYRWAGIYQETKTAATLIDVAYFLGSVDDDMCVGGKTLSHYDESSGEWADTK
jgi:hypothetical protein